MPPQTRMFAAAAAVAATLLAPAQALAGEVLSVDGDRVTRTNDPFVPARSGSDLGRAPTVSPRGSRRSRRNAARPSRRTPRRGAPPSAAGGAHAARAAARSRAAKARRPRKRGPTRGQKAVGQVLRSALRSRGISPATYARYRRLYNRARSTRKRLKGARGRELGAVIATLEGIAIRRQLVSSRMKPLFLILQRNLEYWPRQPFPANRDRVSFRGSELVFEYYRGSGLQLQPLVNFKKANLMHGACVKLTAEPCRRGGLRRLLAELTKTSSLRGGFRAWEYYFTFGGGRPPWISGMAQATGIQAYARAAQLLGDPAHLAPAREGFGAFMQRPPTGIATPGPLGGTHYLQYSFAPRLFIINAFLQANVGLYDFADITGDPTARRLFLAAEPEARAEVPRNDTGDWSTYSLGGRESTREYHELLRELLASTCSRLRTPVYCDTAERFRRYTIDPALLALVGPATVTQGQETRVRFSVSKLSAVQLTITRDGRTALDEVATFRRGSGSFGWEPKSAGSYSVRLAAKELRTGRDLRTRISGQIVSLPEG